MRFVLILFVIVLCVSARENPFAPFETPVASKKVPVQDGVALMDEMSGTSEEAALLAPHVIRDDTDEVANFQHMRFVVSGQQMRIETKDKLIKRFFMGNPDRIVLDFEGNIDFPTRKHAFSNAFFKAIRMGVHTTYYRIVVELDSHRTVTVVPYRYGYILRAD